jgi:hypothetical protein
MGVTTLLPLYNGPRFPAWTCSGATREDELNMAKDEHLHQNLPEAEHRRYARMLVALTVAGLLFCAGQGMRWWQEHRRAQALDAAVQGLYRKALGGDPGRSPYGRLQFELGKLRAESAQRLDVVELLAALSRRAPEGVRIQSLSLASQSGVAIAYAATLEDLERYKAALATEGGFVFAVAKADASALPARFEISVKVRDRAAPPRGEDQ